MHGGTSAVVGARIVKSLHPVLDQEMLEALRRWRFAPAQLDGQTVEVKYLLNQHFSYDDG